MIMSETYGTQAGVPNPYGVPEPPHPPLYFDRTNNTDSSVPGIVITGNPGAGKSRPVYPQAKNWGVITQKEANTKAMFALVFGIVSFFFLGLLLSIPGYFMAKQAEQVNGEYAKAAKIVNLISIWCYALVGIFCLIVFMIALAGYHTSW
jgi:hypothetical protein